MALNVTGQDLRIGARFEGERAAALGRALSEARRTIAVQPAFYTRFSELGCTGLQDRVQDPASRKGRSVS
jgi:hypothetical protein